MMRRMTELRKSFNRDLMISFKDDTLYFASETRTDSSARAASLGDERLLEQFWHEIDFCRTIESE